MPDPGPGADPTAPRRHPPGRHAGPGPHPAATGRGDEEGRRAHDADFVDLYTDTAANTACDGADRAIGGLLEHAPNQLPWYAHPNEKGRDIQAAKAAERIEEILNR